MSVGSASSNSSLGQRGGGRRCNLTVADVYDIAADIGKDFLRRIFDFLSILLRVSPVVIGAVVASGQNH